MDLKNTEDSLLEEVLTTNDGEEVDPKIFDLTMKIVEKMFLKV
jgi:hypothetical protein